MFRIVLLVVCGVFIVSNVAALVTSRKPISKYGLIQTIVYGLMFYYIGIT